MFIKDIIDLYPFINNFTDEQWQHARHNNEDGNPSALDPDVDIFDLLQCCGMSAQDAQDAIIALDTIAISPRPYVEYNADGSMVFGHRLLDGDTMVLVDKKKTFHGSEERAKPWAPELSGKRIYL